MTNTVQLKRSSVANSVPGAANLVPGELAINYADGNLFYKNSSNNVTVIASNKFSSVTGNVTAGNILTVGLVSATGNITSNYFIGNGSQLTGISGTYSNVDVANYLPTYSGNLVSLTGPVVTTANVTGGNILTGGLISAAANITGSNLLTAGLISATGNVTGNYFLGNGSQLTGITAVSSYGNANVVANLAALDSNPVSTTGNISAGYFLGNGSQLTGTGTPLTVSQYTSGNTSNAISNVSTLQFDTTTGFIVTSIGNNAALISMGSSFKTWEVTGQANLVAVGEDIVQFVAGTGISITTNAVSTPQQISFTATYGNSNVGNYLPTYTGNLISLTGPVTTTANITGGNILTGGLISATGNVTGNYFLGNGSQLTGIAASYGNANVVANLAALGTNPVSTTGNIDGGNLSGTNIVGTLITALQTNITAVGTLGSLTVTANTTSGNLLTAGLISVAGNITANTGSFFIGNGSQLTGITAVSSYGNANVVANLAALGSNPISTTGNITGNYILGNGSQLTGLATTSITTDSFTGNGSTTTFTLSTTPSSINATTVNYNGVTLLRSSYSVNVANVIFSSAPANNSNIEITTLTSGSSGSTGSSLIWNIASSNATMTASNGYFVDTSSSAKTMTLPASVTLGDTIQINDLAGTFATNNLTVARNGQNIQGVANNLVVSTNQSSFDLVYSNSTYGWKILGL